MSAPTTAPIGRTLLAWSGLDVDTTALDLELREALARVAPEGGELRQLAPTASVIEAHTALRCDATALAIARQGDDGDAFPTVEETAAVYLSAALHDLDRARMALVDAREALAQARRLLGLA